ncbi:MAG: DUF4316 domain-containing protein [Lachnospiraceae bacterium]
MSERTRQRQGRDFPVNKKPENYLKNTEMSMEGNYNMLDGVINNLPSDGEERKTSLLEQLDRLKEDSEKNAGPIDGKEPPEREDYPQRHI